jgi:hypothetical protein
VPVVRGVAFKNQKEADAYLLADNRQAELGGWDDVMLGEMLGEQVDAMDGIGFGLDDISPEEDLPTVAPPKAEVAQTERNHYETAVIKQIVLYFDGAQFDDVVARMAKVMAKLGVNSNTDAFLALLEAYEAGQGNGATAG